MSTSTGIAKIRSISTSPMMLSCVRKLAVAIRLRHAMKITSNEKSPQAQNNEQYAERHADNTTDRGGGAPRCSGRAAEQDEPCNPNRRTHGEVTEDQRRSIG